MARNRASTAHRNLLPAVITRTCWSGFQEGDLVSVSEADAASFKALVETLAHNNSLVWVVSLGGTDRRLFHHTDDVSIRLHSAEPRK